jgi:hypothetical protein
MADISNLSTRAINSLVYHEKCTPEEADSYRASSDLFWERAIVKCRRKYKNDGLVDQAITLSFKGDFDNIPMRFYFDYLDADCSKIKYDLP